MPSDRDLNHIYLPMRNIVQEILHDLQTYLDKNFPGYTCFVVEGFRTAKYQNELWRKGRFTKPLGKKYIVTARDGYILKSNHQSSLAVDITFKDSAGNVLWNVPQVIWEYLGHLARANDIKWGGDWKKPDRPHIEWDPKDKETYKRAIVWQKQVGLK